MRELRGGFIIKRNERELLIQLRGFLVAQFHVQPFKVYQDSIIDEIVKVRPHSLVELSKIKGFPENGKRVRLFGEAIVAIFRTNKNIDEIKALVKLEEVEKVKRKSTSKKAKGNEESSSSKKMKAFLPATLLMLAASPLTVSNAATDVQHTQQSVNLAKQSFLTETKEQSKEAWNEVLENRVVEKEAVRIKEKAAIKKLIDDDKKKTVAIKARSIKKISNDVSIAKRSSIKASKLAERYAKELKKKARAKARAAAREAEEFSYYDTYGIGYEGRSEWKSWEAYNDESDENGIVFIHSSDQYALQLQAYTGDYGIRMVGDRYCVAVGSRFTERIGAKIDVVLENGSVIKCILGDQKADKDTDETNSYHLSDGSYLEFIVDLNSLNPDARRLGTLGCIDDFSGRIVEIRVYRS